MNYKKGIFVYIVLFIIFTLVVSTCSKKKKEEDITITLKTESAISSHQITPSTSTLSKPLKKEKPKIVSSPKKEVEIRQKKMEITSSQQQISKEPQVQQQVAVNTPAPQPQPSLEDIAKQEIMSIINRQKQAMKTKNISLALEDLAGNTNQNKKALEDYFNRYEKIDVDFYNISININGNNAFVIMNQKTSVVTKSLIPQTISEQTKVQWTFVKEDNRWLISGTQILGRMKE